MEKADRNIGFFWKFLMVYFYKIFTILYKGKNGDYSILCINYQNGTIFKMKQFLPKDDIEASKICFYLNLILSYSSVVDYTGIW